MPVMVRGKDGEMKEIGERVSWLVHCPPGDQNFKDNLHKAAIAEIEEALELLRNRPQSKAAIAACERELRRKREEEEQVAETIGTWKITTNVINGETRYGVYRSLGNPGEPDHSGNREVFDYFETREEAEKVAAEFNQVESDKQDFEDEFKPAADILNHTAVPDEVKGTAQLRIEAIYESHYNPRKRFDEDRLKELAQSIKEVGVLQPLIVTKGVAGRYLLIAGERRLKAAKMAGLEYVPVAYRETNARDIRPLMLIENLQREDLDPIEEAQAFKTLTQDHGWKQTELAEKLGISQSHIANRIRLLVLPESVQEGISQGTVTATVGKELATYAKVPGVNEMLDEAMADGDDDGDALIWTAKNNAYNHVAPLHKEGHPHPEFDLKGCIGCKEKTMLPGRWGNTERLPWCIDVSCWEEKQEAALREIAEKAKQQAIEAGENVLELKDLPGESYAGLGAARFDTADCTQCEHRRQGRHSWMDDDDEPKDVCLNPECFKAKKSTHDKAERQREKAIKDAHEERKDSLIAGFFPQALLSEDVDPYGPDYRALIYMTAKAIDCNGKEEDICERYGWNVPEDLGWAEGLKHLVQQLVTLTVPELLRALFFVTLESASYGDVVFQAVYGEGAPADESD